MTQTRYLTREEAEALARRTLGFSRADEARVLIESGSEGNTRFAVNQISTAGDSYDATVRVTSAFAKRVASATSNRFDDESLRQVVETSERLARLAPEDPEHMPEPGPQAYMEVPGYFESVAGVTPEERVRAVMQVARPAAERGLVSTGFLTHRAASRAVANTRGLFAYARGTGANFTTTVRTPDGTGSGWAGTGANDWAELDFGRLAETAIGKAELSRDPRAVEPGRWTVILEPTAVANMVGLMMGQLGARAADEGRSFFSRRGGGNRIGERFVDERVTIATDPADPRTLALPFDAEGMPNRPMTWVEDGVLRNLNYSRFWAARNQVEPTPAPAAYRMAGGDATIDEMIRSTDRGLLVTRLWYIRSVDPRTILFTGLTRDGTFLIENGRITSAVKNLRWNESPIFLLNNIEMMGRPVRVTTSESGSIGASVMVPPIKARDFTFTSLSDAV
jgi:predicted Zn-dependent protease